MNMKGIRIEFLDTIGMISFRIITAYACSGYINDLENAKHSYYYRWGV